MMQITPIDVLAMQARLDGMRAEALEAGASMAAMQASIDRERRETWMRMIRDANTVAAREAEAKRYWRKLCGIMAVAIGFVTLSYAVAYWWSR